MSQSNDNSVNQRLDQSVNGAPMLNPDEQRKYLGTFRERVSLAIKIKDLKRTNAIAGFKREIKSHPHYQLIINGNLDQSLIEPYLQTASQNNVKFTIKTDSFYFNKPESYGLVYAAGIAINQYPVDVNQKYPDSGPKAKPQSQTKSDRPSFFSKLKKWL